MAYGGPSDFHNDVELSANEPPAVFHPPMHEQHSVVTTGLAVDQSALELAAFEKGRMQGEMEAVRRLEAEQPKRFNEEVTHTRTTNLLEDVVEVNQLTRTQWAAALFGELAGLAYIVIMAIWIDQYRAGGVGWDNNDQNGNRGMFNVHILTSFLGLWCAAQAYITYRVLPMHMSVIVNKLYYIACHIAALGCFALSVASATMSQPSTRAWTMHAWTAYLALAIYAAHAIYSSIKVLVDPFGITTSNWNETRNGELYGAAATADAARAHLRATPEQSRDGDLVRPTLYIAGPSVGFWRRHTNEKNLDIDARNANMGAAHGPMWSERATYTAEQFFLVPRAKWGVTALFCLMATLLVGLGELQMLNALGRDNWTTDLFNQSPLRDFSTDSRLFGVLGLLTLLSTAALGYAAMPPRTTLAKGTTDRVQEMQRRRTSISSAAPSTVQNSRLSVAQPAAIEVV